MASSGYCFSFFTGRVTLGIQALMQLIKIDLKGRGLIGENDAPGSQGASGYLGWIWSGNR